MQDIVKIIQYFAEISSKIKMSNQLNLLDINIYCENQVMEALNSLYGWKLCNLNAKSQNSTAIDLVDDKNRIAIQVTPDTRNTKIKETLEKIQKPHSQIMNFICFICAKACLQIQKKQFKAIKSNVYAFLIWCVSFIRI